MTSPDYQRLRYETLVREHAAELHRFAYRLTGKIDAAQDLVQETFLEAWRSLARQTTPGGERAWLFSILRHRWAHFCRDASRRIRTNGNGEHLAFQATAAPGVVEALASEESMQSVLNTLDAPYKEAFLMVFLQGLTCKEAAAELGVPLGTVLSRVSRARESLRMTLAKERLPHGAVRLAEGRVQ